MSANTNRKPIEPINNLFLFGVLDRYVHSDNPERHAFANRGLSGPILTRPQILTCAAWAVDLWADFAVCERGLPRTSLIDSVEEFAGVAQTWAGIVIENLAKRAENPLGYSVDSLKGTIFSVVKKRIAAASAARVELSQLIAAADDFLAMADEPAQNVFSTGFAGLDVLWEGIKDGELTLIVGPTGSGKTFFLLKILLHRARAGQPVIIFATELRRKVNYARLAALAAGGKLGNPNVILRDPTKELLRQAATALKGLGIYVFSFAEMDDGGDPLAFIESKISQVEDETGLSPIVGVDYLGDLVRSDELNRRQATSGVSKRLRLLSTRKNLAIVALAATARANHLKSDQPVSLDPLDYSTSAKESGDQEYDAGQQAFLVTLPKPDPEVRYRDAAVIVTKTRGGNTGAVGFRFDTGTGSFEEDPGALGRIEKRSKAADEGKRVDQLDLLCDLIRRGHRLADGGREPMTRNILRGCKGVKKNDLPKNLEALFRNKRVRELDVPRGALEILEPEAPSAPNTAS